MLWGSCSAAKKREKGVSANFCDRILIQRAKVAVRGVPGKQKKYPFGRPQAVIVVGRPLVFLICLGTTHMFVFRFLRFVSMIALQSTSSWLRYVVV
jgi:hypothetical protein